MRAYQQRQTTRFCLLVFLIVTLIATCAAAPPPGEHQSKENAPSHKKGSGFMFQGGLAITSAAVGAGICYFWVRRKRDSFAQIAENAGITAQDEMPIREIVITDVDAAETKATGIGAGRAAAAAMQEQRSDAEDAAANESRLGKSRSQLFVWQVGDAQLHLPRFSFETNTGDSRNNSMTNLAATLQHEDYHSEAPSQNTGSTGENERY